MPDRMGFDLNFGNNPIRKSNMNTNTLIPTKTSNDLVKERLADLKENLLNEQRSKKPSPLYIKDLEASIKQCERMLGV